MSLSEESLLKFLRESIGLDTSDIKPESLLFSSGIIDSFSLVSLLTFVESSCELRIDPMDVNLDNFDSIEKVLNYVKRRQSDMRIANR